MKIKNMFSLENKVALNFGGNGYLGSNFNEAMLGYGAKVYSCDLKNDNNKNNTLKSKYGEKLKTIKVDATKKEELLKIYNLIIKNEKKLDILVNSTTMKGDDFYLPFEEVSLEGWNTGLLGNLTIPFLTIQMFIPIMKKQKSGSIINISSHYGLVGNDQRIYEGSNLHEVYTDNSTDNQRIYSHGVYNAAKGGLNNFTRYLAAYYGEYNIRINCLSPGGIYQEDENKTFLKNYSEKVPLGRKARADEMKGGLIFLASDSSSYVTGHNLVIDGGYTIW